MSKEEMQKLIEALYSVAYKVINIEYNENYDVSSPNEVRECNIKIILK